MQTFLFVERGASKHKHSFKTRWSVQQLHRERHGSQESSQFESECEPWMVSLKLTLDWWLLFTSGIEPSWQPRVRSPLLRTIFAEGEPDNAYSPQQPCDRSLPSLLLQELDFVEEVDVLSESLRSGFAVRCSVSCADNVYEFSLGVRIFTTLCSLLKDFWLPSIFGELVHELAILGWRSCWWTRAVSFTNSS